MKVDFEAVQATFLQVLEKPEKARDSFIVEVCGDNLELRNQIQILLKAHFDGTGLLDRGLTNEPSCGARAGDKIGPYKLREKIGEGGFGVVYVAEQKEPVSRKVALKVIKPGMDSKDIIARFEAERQALAMMDHPNVAKVLDAGATEYSRPYFVMELVHGVSVTEYCDSKKLTNHERLELFIDVCHAVQHAHQKGIIHRDLKPSNVMVMMADHRPVIKVIDFGVAKALHHDLTDKSINTGYGQMIGTPMYMSPEQAKLSSLDVDTRSDIYSLGVLLYELLTGTTPFDKETFKTAGFDEVRRMIREVEPRRPSDRVSTLNAHAISTIANCRRVDQSTLSRTLKRELDWMVMKALDKDRGRRYETAASFAEDIQRFLNDEPVSALPPSRKYKFQKFVRRNRRNVVLAMIFTSIFLWGIIFSFWYSNNRFSRRVEHLKNENRLSSRRLNWTHQAVADIFGDEIVGAIGGSSFGEMGDLNKRDIANVCNNRAWKTAIIPGAEKNKYFESLFFANKATILFPKVASYWNTLGLVQIRCGLISEAIESIKMAENLESSGRTGAFNSIILAMAHWKNGSKEESIALLEKADRQIDSFLSENSKKNRFDADAKFARDKAHLEILYGEAKQLIQPAIDKKVEVNQSNAISGFEIIRSK